LAKKYDNSKAWAKNHRINENGVVERRCSNSKCNQWLEENEDNFYLHNKNKPEKGYSSECKRCAIKRSQAIAEKIPEEKQEQLKIERKLRYERDKKIELKRVKVWFRNNKDIKREYWRDYYIKNPEKMKLYADNHRNHDITNTEWTAVQKFFNCTCAYCGKTLEQQYIDNNEQFHKEHVEHDGYNDIRNCVCACSNCNSTKRKRNIKELYESRDINGFTQDKYEKILSWCNKEYKKYIEPKLPYRITRKQNEGLKTYHWELWSVDDKRNFIECISMADKKKLLKQELENIITNHYQM